MVKFLYLLLNNNYYLNTLIKILHLICNGLITIRKEDHKVIVKSKRMNLLRLKFEKKEHFLQMLQESDDNKRAVLKQFSAIYKPILYTMFNEI